MAPLICPQRSSLVVVFAGVLGAVLLASGPDPARAGARQDAAGDGWPEISKEDRALTRVEQDPDADAVVLLNVRNGKILRLADDTINVIDQQVRLKVLTERGKRYGEVEIRAGKYSRVSNIQARTVRPDGTIVPVAPDQIFEKVTLQVGSYKETAWVFHFPAVEPGAILDYRYDRHDNSIYFIDPFYFAGPEFTLRAKVTQAIPEDMGYASLCDLCPKNQAPVVTPWREGKAKGQLYTQELKDVPGYRDELLMPPARDASPRMEMVLTNWKDHAEWGLSRQNRYFIDWPSVSLYASTYYQDVVKNGVSSLKPIVEGWMQGAADPQERMKSIYRHVQRDFRYLDFINVQGRARSIDVMLKDRVADNEDKAVLLMAALKTAGVDSYTVLVSGKNGGSLNPKFFSLTQFTHAIVAVPQPGGTYQFLDPTIAYAPFGFMPWKDSGAEALLLKGGQGEMITLPIKNELNVSRYRISVVPRLDGKADIEVEGQLYGEDAQDLREELVPSSESARKEFLEAWVAKQRPAASLRSFSLEDLEEVDKPLRVKLSLEAPGLVTVADEAVLVRGCVLSCIDSNPVSRAARQYPFYVDRGWNEDETVTVQAPSGMQAAQTPTSSVKSAVGTYTFSCSGQGDGSARCARQFVARRVRLPESEQTNLRAMFEKVVEADRTAVVFRRAAAGDAGGSP